MAKGRSIPRVGRVEAQWQAAASGPPWRPSYTRANAPSSAGPVAGGAERPGRITRVATRRECRAAAAAAARRRQTGAGYSTANAAPAIAHLGPGAARGASCRRVARAAGGCFSPNVPSALDRGGAGKRSTSGRRGGRRGEQQRVRADRVEQGHRKDAGAIKHAGGPPRAASAGARKLTAGRVEPGVAAADGDRGSGVRSRSLTHG